MVEFPLVRQPDVEVARGPGGEVHEELRQTELGIDLVAAAGGGQTRQDDGGAAAARVAANKEFFRFSTTRFISRSLTLLSMGTPPSEQKTFSSARWPRV